jgi:hypothetical protein
MCHFHYFSNTDCFAMDMHYYRGIVCNLLDDMGYSPDIGKSKKGARKFLSVKSKVSLIMVIVLIVHVASFGIAMIMGSKRYEN